MRWVLLHGFAGTGRTWEPLGLYEPARCPDLPGHGTRRGDRTVTWDGAVAAVLDAAPARFGLAGYSMGGRLALHVALAAPDRVERLVLLATTAGIEDPAERAARRRADEELADWAEGHTIEEFADRWTSLPLFAGTPPDAAAWWRADLLRNDPRGLAASLRGMGTGTMEPLWGRLGELELPTAVAAGQDDAKFRALGERLAAAIPGCPDGLRVVPGAGHGLPREAPGAVRALLGPV